MSRPEEDSLQRDQSRPQIPPPRNLQYVVAVVVMSGLGIVSVLAITLMKPEQDNTVIIASVFGFLLPTTMALLAFMKSQETHLSVNSRLEAFINEARELARAEGMVAGREAAERREDRVAQQEEQKKD